MKKLLWLPLLLSIGTGCLEIERHVVLNADGTARIADSLAFSKGAMEIFKKMAAIDPSMSMTAKAPEVPSVKDLKPLEKKGVKVTKFDHTFTEDVFSFALEMELDTLGALVHAKEIAPREKDKAVEEIPISLTKVGKNTYKLQLRGEDPPDKPEKPAPEPGKEGKELTPEQQQEVMELAMSLAGEAGSLSLVQSATVPGKLLDYGPKFGKQKKNKVTWTQGAKEMMADPNDPKHVADDGNRWITFELEGLPEKALYTPAG